MEVVVDRFAARADDIVIEELDGGLVVYDGREAVAHWLDPSAAAVWRACREPSAEPDIAKAAELEAPTCELVLSQLVDLGLVEAESDSGYSRRVVLRTAAKLGLAGAMSAPIISAVVPAAAAAASALPPQPPSPPPGPTPQSIGADHNFVPGAPSVSDVTVTVARVNGKGSGGNKHPSDAFSIRRATVNHQGVVVLTLAARSAGAFAAAASFSAVQIMPARKRPHLQGAYGSGSANLAERGSVNLGIAPTRVAQRALAAGAHLTVSVKITFMPVGGSAHTLTATLSFSERRQNRP